MSLARGAPRSSAVGSHSGGKDTISPHRTQRGPCGPETRANSRGFSALARAGGPTQIRRGPRARREDARCVRRARCPACGRAGWPAAGVGRVRAPGPFTIQGGRRPVPGLPGISTGRVAGVGPGRASAQPPEAVSADKTKNRGGGDSLVEASGIPASQPATRNPAPWAVAGLWPQTRSAETVAGARRAVARTEGTPGKVVRTEPSSRLAPRIGVTLRGPISRAGGDAGRPGTGGEAAPAPSADERAVRRAPPPFVARRLSRGGGRRGGDTRAGPDLDGSGARGGRGQRRGPSRK